MRSLMSMKQSTAQLLETIEISDADDAIPVILLSQPDLEILDFDPFQGVPEEVVSEGNPTEIELIIEDLPGVIELDPEFEKKLETKEEDSNEADSKKSKRDPHWDWESQGLEYFVPWAHEKIKNVPKHSGKDIAGIDRVISVYERLQDEASKAMRSDINGVLDADVIEHLGAELEKGLNSLHARREKLHNFKNKGKKKKKADNQPELIKEAQKAVNLVGMVITADVFLSRIARVCINSTISAGKDLNNTYQDQVKKWKLDKREQASVMQLLADFGYPLRQDRGFLPDEEVDLTSEDNFDWMPNYQA